MGYIPPRVTYCAPDPNRRPKETEGLFSGGVFWPLMSVILLMIIYSTFTDSDGPIKEYHYARAYYDGRLTPERRVLDSFKTKTPCYRYAVQQWACPSKYEGWYEVLNNPFVDGKPWDPKDGIR